MRILITGKRGQVAQALAHVHDPSHHDLIFVGRPEVDMSSPQALREPVLRARPDIIISVAAHTQVDRCESEPDLAFAINAEAPAVLAQAAADLGVPIIHLSTDYVFDGETHIPYVESDPARPLNVYGRSKLAGEQAIAAATDRHAIVRVTWVYSSYAANFVKLMLGLALTQPEISVVDDQIACPTPALELARGLFTMADRLIRTTDTAAYGLFHGAGATSVDRFTFAEGALNYASARGHPLPVLRRVSSRSFRAAAPRPHYSALNSSKLEAVYGVRLPGWQNSLEACVHRILDMAPESEG
ncbi:MAG: dTDP-4-dehydrorhamnose reductase [Asticcacaulis sp.]